ncbi:acyl-CoA dehydrogenase [Streptomyces sp. NPDC016309]|uniref:acyl-CoA dehydrogenase n=1 Tax=Streptomyces sp. NPDC016309 TaxID=3364965 RepID=UPI0036F59455
MTSATAKTVTAPAPVTDAGPEPGAGSGFGPGPGAGPAGRTDVLRVARDVADDLAADAVPRDRAGRQPADEAARLREAGLPGLLVPPGPGRGVDWRTGCAVIQEVATADSSVGALLARHYVHTWSGRFYGAAHRASALEGDTAREQWLWSGDVHTTPPDGAAPELTLTPLDSGHLLHGRVAVDTAVTVADQFVVDAFCAVTGDVLVVRVPSGRPGVSVEPAGDRLGQRVAGAGSVTFDRVTVAPAQVLGPRPHDAESTAPFTALADPALRLALCHVGLGIAEGALAEARDTSRNALPAKDPDLLLAYGELASAAHTAAVVVERATETMAGALEAGPHLGVEEPADVAALVATAETVTARAALHITTRVLELADTPGLDRFWRNARVLTAHRSTAHRLRDIGEHYLNGTHRLAAVGR